MEEKLWSSPHVIYCSVLHLRRKRSILKYWSFLSALSLGLWCCSIRLSLQRTWKGGVFPEASLHFNAKDKLLCSQTEEMLLCSVVLMGFKMQLHQTWTDWVLPWENFLLNNRTNQWNACVCSNKRVCKCSVMEGRTGRTGPGSGSGVSQLHVHLRKDTQRLPWKLFLLLLILQFSPPESRERGRERQIDREKERERER